jgi:Tol biopolymer transport system component
MRADGSHRVRLLSSRLTIGSPTWSADGRYLAFARGIGPDQIAIFVADSRGRVRWHFGGGRTNLEERDYLPLWSPDGQRPPGCSSSPASAASGRSVSRDGQAKRIKEERRAAPGPPATAASLG